MDGVGLTWENILHAGSGSFMADCRFKIGGKWKWKLLRKYNRPINEKGKVLRS